MQNWRAWRKFRWSNDIFCFSLRQKTQATRENQTSDSVIWCYWTGSGEFCQLTPAEGWAGEHCGDLHGVQDRAQVGVPCPALEAGTGPQLQCCSCTCHPEGAGEGRGKWHGKRSQFLCILSYLQWYHESRDHLTDQETDEKCLIPAHVACTWWKVEKLWAFKSPRNLSALASGWQPWPLKRPCVPVCHEVLLSEKWQGPKPTMTFSQD